MRVLIIPEDFRKDQYVLQPVISAMLKELGKPQAKVIVCRDPLLGGIDQALRWERIEDIISRYRGMIDLFILCVDRDGREGRRITLDQLESQAATTLSERQLFLAENAWQEIEVWVLAGHDPLPGWSWNEIRAEINPKERYYLPLAQQRQLLDEPGEGRKTLAQEAVRRYSRMRDRCPEDLAVLENRLREWIRRIV